MHSQTRFVLLVLVFYGLIWQADAFFALTGIVRVQSVCVQSSIWSPAPALVQNLCLQCFCVRAAFSLSICSVIPNLYVQLGTCTPFIPNVTTAITPVVTVPPVTTTTTTTLAPPLIPPTTPAGFVLPAAPGVGAILPATPGIAAGAILPASPAVAGAGQISPINQALLQAAAFPGLNYLPGQINTFGGVPATLSPPGSGIAGVGFTAPNTFSNLAGGFQTLFTGKRK